MPQMSQDPTPGWLGWAVPLGIAVVAGAWAFLKRFFVTVTRAELKEALERMARELAAARELEDKRRSEERAAMHGQNLENFRAVQEDLREMFGRMSKVESGLSRIEGQLSGRFPTLPPQSPPPRRG